jgi:hypothetical protein
MTINWVRGFRRFGWVVTIPLAGFVVFLFYDGTKDVFRYDRKQVEREANSWEKVIEIPSIRGKAYFPMEIDGETIRNVVAEIEAKEKSPAFEEAISTGFDLHTSPYEIIPHKRLNILKLAGLIFVSFAVVAIIIQGSISILAWVLRGFKGTLHINVS